MIGPFLGNKMRIAKFCVLVIILIFGFALQSEVTNYELWNYSSAYYRNSEYTYENEEERLELIEDIFNGCEKYNVECFSEYYKDIDGINVDYTVFYKSDKTKEELLKKNRVTEHRYISLLSGNVEVEFKGFLEQKSENYKYIYDVSFIGNDDDIDKLYEFLSENHSISYPAITNGSERDVIYSVWSIIVFICILMTCMEIIYNKKEYIVRISLGESVKRIILYNIIINMIISWLLFFAIRAAVFSVLYGEFMRTQICILYGIGVGLSCLCYLSYGIYDIKKAFSNVNDTKVILRTTYVIKVAVTAITIFTLVTNLSILLKDAASLSNASMIENLKGYSYIRLNILGHDIENNSLDEYINAIYKKIYKEYYEESAPIICEHALIDEDNNVNYLKVNENGKCFIDKYLDLTEIDDKSDVAVFVPKGKIDAVDFDEVEYIVDELGIGATDTKIQYIYYKGNISVPYIDQRIDLENVMNPVVILQNRMDIEKYNGELFSSDYRKIMFNLSETQIDEIKKKYEIDTKGLELIQVDVNESYTYHNNFIRKLIAFCSSLCFFSIILQMVLIILIVRMEYKLHAMELAVKKILGYGLTERNKFLICFGVITNLIVMILVMIIGNFLVKISLPLCLLIGISVIFLELLVTFINLFIIEKNSVSKILKGGCL